ETFGRLCIAASEVSGIEADQGGRVSLAIFKAIEILGRYGDHGGLRQHLSAAGVKEVVDKSEGAIVTGGTAGDGTSNEIFVFDIILEVNAGAGFQLGAGIVIAEPLEHLLLLGFLHSGAANDDLRPNLVVDGLTQADQLVVRLIEVLPAGYRDIRHCGAIGNDQPGLDLEVVLCIELEILIAFARRGGLYGGIVIAIYG